MRFLKHILIIVGLPVFAAAECAFVDFDANSNIIRAKIIDTTDGQGMTGLDHTSSGLIISTIANNEATATTYTVAGSTVETISTLGTYAAPTSTKVRFKAVDGTNHPGIYEFQVADARFSVASAKSLILSASGVANMQEMDCQIQLTNTLTDIAAAILGATASSYNSAGTIGEKINSGGGSSVRRW